MEIGSMEQTGEDIMTNMIAEFEKWVHIIFTSFGYDDDDNNDDG